MFKMISHSCKETENLGNKISKILTGKEVIAMFGGMGSGKTSLVRGIAAGLNLSDEVSSPTFSLVNEYQSGEFPVYHFDMYRVMGWESLYSTGFFDYIDNGVLIIEWSENIEEFLPKDSMKIYISMGNEEDERIVETENKCLGKIIEETKKEGGLDK